MFRFALITITAVAITSFTVTSSMAATVKCTVTEHTGSTVTLDCGSKAGNFKAGTAVKVKTAAKTAAIEGC